MTQKDSNPDYKGIFEEACSRYKNTSHFSSGPTDETFYTMRVFETAKKIIEAEGKDCDRACVLTAAILHDIGKTMIDGDKIFSEIGFKDDFKKEWHKHAAAGVPVARTILEQEGHSEEFIKKVCYLVKNHDNRDLNKKSYELMVLQDADQVADTGIAGFIRPFLFGGKNGRSITDSIKFYLDNADIVERKGGLNLESSRNILSSKRAFQKILKKEIQKEIESTLF